MLAQYDPERHRASAHTFGQDHFVACASYRTLGLWFLGFVDQARRSSERAIDYARSLNHTHTLQFALAYAGALFAASCGDIEYLQSTTAELLEIGRDLRSPGWSAAVSGLHGKLLIALGKSSEGVAKLWTGITAFRERHSPLWQPTFCVWLAEAHASAASSPRGSLRWRSAGKLRLVEPTGWMRNCSEWRANSGKPEGCLIILIRSRSLVRPSWLPDRNRRARWNCGPQ